MIGETISHYKILEKLGGGGMGVVYRAEDLKLKRLVALKFLPPELTRDDEAKKRFIHEAQAASALQHNNICTIHEIDETPDGQIFIAMDCYAGETLKERIAKGPLPISEAVDIAAQIAVGLSKAHGAGMVHRDVKPANIMVTKDGGVKILDFGLAKLAGQTKLTRTGTTLGTVAYMSPEQAKGAEVDARSDVFSLGAVFYEMLAGEVPFPGEHEAAVLYGIMNTEPKPLDGSHGVILNNLQRVIDKALKKDPAERYQTVLELLDDLETVRVEIGGGSAGRRRTAHSAAGPRGRSRTRLIVAVASAVAIVAVLASILLPRLWRPAPNRARLALAVMDFRDLATPDDPTVSAGITELVNIGLTEVDIARVVSSDLLHDLRRRLFGSTRGAIEESQTIEIARKAGAALFLTGTIRESDAGKLVTWHLVDARSGDDVKAGQVEGNEFATLADQMIAAALPLIARVCGVEAANATSVENITTKSNLAYQHFIAGVLAAEEARPVESLAELKKAVAQDSTFALAYLWLARIYFGPVGFQQERQAAECAEKAWALRSRLGEKDKLRLEALRYDLGGRVGDAIATLRRMVERWPDDRDTIAELEQRLFWHWDFADAVEAAEKGRLFYPDDIYLAGAAYIQALAYLGRLDESIRAAQSYARKHPQETKSWDQIHEIYLAMGNPDSAEAACRRAMELDPSWGPNNPTKLSRCAYHRGDLQGAIRDLEQALENKALDQGLRKMLIIGNALNANLATYYIEAGRYRKAREACRDYSPLRDIIVGRHMLAMGQAREVLDLAMRWTEEDTTRRTYIRAINLRGRAMAALGDNKGAREAAEELLDPEFGSGGNRFYAYSVLAEVALAEGDPERALEHLATIKRRGVPTGGLVDIDYRAAVARAYRKAGQLDEAAKAHAEMLRIYGGHALSHYELGTIYEEMKRPAEAKKEYTKFLEMWSQADEGLPQLIDARKRLAAL